MLKLKDCLSGDHFSRYFYAGTKLRASSVHLSWAAITQLPYDNFVVEDESKVCVEENSSVKTT